MNDDAEIVLSTSKFSSQYSHCSPTILVSPCVCLVVTFDHKSPCTHTTEIRVETVVVLGSVYLETTHRVAALITKIASEVFQCAVPGSIGFLTIHIFYLWGIRYVMVMFRIHETSELLLHVEDLSIK